MSRDENIYMDQSPRALRQFGCGLGFLLAGFGALLFAQNSLAGAVLILIACGTICAFWWRWPGTHRFYAGWMAAAALLSKVMTAVFLSMVYFLVLTPLSLLARLLGRQFLDRRFGAACETYWIERRDTGPGHSCEKQY